MECQVVSLSSDRLKREDCLHPEHDSLFSDWKVLVGPSDWEDHSLGKEGVERYRFHNLPDCSSCSGLYELGIVIPRAHSGHLIVPVYLGQTDNVRTRLQCYGRDGAHLENGNSNGQVNDYPQQGHGPFSEAFSNGYSIAYRWAPMKNKAEAEKTETRVLKTYDYAWNKGNNGVRRRGDVLRKLDGSTSSSIQFLTLFHEKNVKIDTCKPLSWEDGSRIYTNWESNDLLPQIFKSGRSQPRLVTPSLGFNDDHSNICGVALGHGSVCTRPPVGGRKRCDAHKGMKIIDFASNKLLTEGKSLVNSSPSCGVTLDNGSVCRSVVKEDYSSTCGATLHDGSACRRPPAEGRKRCWQHKGMWGNTERPTHSFTSSYDTGGISSGICGASTRNGSICHRTPVRGRMRCEQHKGKRAVEG